VHIADDAGQVLGVHRILADIGGDDFRHHLEDVVLIVPGHARFPQSNCRVSGQGSRRNLGRTARPADENTGFSGPLPARHNFPPDPLDLVPPKA
jgi:hypothetical protein